MTRIIAGTAGGRTISVPASGTRPTSDRVRESMFSTLSSRLGDWSDHVVLDLYAGSGALGIEALSRGAAQAWFVEQSKAACAVLSANLQTIGLSGGHVLATSVARFAAHPPAALPIVDVCFADPPYDIPADQVSQSLLGLELAGKFGNHTLVVVERPTRDESDPFPPGWTSVSRRMGDTVLWYGHRQ